MLGDFEVHQDGRAVNLGGPKQRALLAILVAARGRPVPVDRLVDQIWGEDPPPAVLGSLHVQVAKLRKQLEPDRGPRAEPQVLVTKPSGYALLLPADAVDAEVFARMVAESQGTTSSSATTELLTAALELWSGPAYGGISELSQVLATEAARLEELRLDAVEQLWAARIESGDHVSAAAELRTLVAEHPLRERLWGLLALALYRSDRQAHALEALQEVRRHLADELGLDPGEELRALEQAMLRQESSLLVERPPRGAGNAPVSRDEPAAEEPAADDALPGREDALARTRRALGEVARGRGQVVLVTGQPGIGKTRFAQAVVTQAAAAGLNHGWGTWEAEGCPPLWGWKQATETLLGDRFSVSSDTAGRDAASSMFELAEELADALREAGGSCLVLDDLHWADPDSQRLLRRIAATVADVPVLLVLLTRESEADRDPVLAQTLAALARLEAARISLTGLDSGAVAEYVRQSTGVEVADELAERLRERTDGNPFHLNEMVRTLSAAGALEDGTDARWTEVPAGVRDVISHRVSELPPSVGLVLADAAVLGRTFDADVLERAWTGAPGVVDPALETALTAALVEEEQPGRYRFRHALARDALYQQIAGPARSRAHARVAQALERQRVGRLDAHAAELAEHYRLAGPTHARSAWTYADRAAGLASEQGAYDDATLLLHSAVALQDDDPLVTDVERERVAVAHGRALHRLARTYEASDMLERAARSALSRGDAVTAAQTLLVVTEGAVWSWRPPGVVHEPGIDLWREVLDALPADEDALRARCTGALAAEWMYAPGSGDVAAALVDEAMHIARRVADPTLLRDVLNLSHLALHRPDQGLRRLPIADELVTLSVRYRDDTALASALCRRGQDRAELGRWSDGVADYEQALELATRHHLVPVLLIARYALGVVAQAHGRWEESVAVIAQNEAFETTMSLTSTGIGLGQLASVRMWEGRLPELEPALKEALPWHASFRDLHALALVSGGRLAEARSALGPWKAQPGISWDYLWVSSTVLRARVWAALEDLEAVADLRAELAPFAERLAVGGMTAYVFGSVHHTLALLALTAGDLDEARQHAATALAVHRQLGFGPLEAETEKLLARIEELDRR